MQRRDFLTHSIALGAGALVAPQFALAGDKGEKKDSSLSLTATQCLDAGEHCLQHCMESLSTGNKAMAACAESVREMMIYCEALAKASARKSKRLTQIAKIAAEACKDCEAECRKHQKMATCKSCAEACAACLKECEKISA